MRISGPRGGGPKSVDRAKAAPKIARKASVSAPRVESFGDAVSVNDYSSTLDMIRDIVESTPDIRTEEIDRIVRDLRSGRYKIDFKKVAEGFIKETLLTELSKKPRAKS